MWLYDEELFVGHSTSSLTPNRTFRNLYINPLVEILDRQNQQTDFTIGKTRNGVFDEEPEQTLILLVDFKTDGSELWPYVQEQINALRDRNYLAYYNGQELVNGPITVVGTGNTPFDLVTANTTYRDIFFDAPLEKLYERPEPFEKHSVRSFISKEAEAPGQGLSGISPSSEPFAANNSYYASVDFRGTIGFLWGGSFSKKQIKRIRSQVESAHQRGLKARYWNTPGWPKHIRNQVWRELFKQGVDYLNVDNLKDAARTDWAGRGERPRT